MQILEEILDDKVRSKDKVTRVLRHDCTIIGTIRIDHISRVIEKGDIFPHLILDKEWVNREQVLGLICSSLRASACR